MNAEELIAALRRLGVETGSLACLGCGHEHNCGTRGCAILRAAADLIEALQAQLAESQRRERAAVDDLEGTGACFTCKHFRRNGGDCFGAGRCRLDGIEIWPCNEPGVYRVEVPDDGRQTYEWRGPQEAGEGAAE